jgi:hypothetical protein
MPRRSSGRARGLPRPCSELSRFASKSERSWVPDSSDTVAWAIASGALSYRNRREAIRSLLSWRVTASDDSQQRRLRSLALLPWWVFDTLRSECRSPIREAEAGDRPHISPTQPSSTQVRSVGIINGWRACSRSSSRSCEGSRREQGAGTAAGAVVTRTTSACAARRSRGLRPSGPGSSPVTR